MFCNVFRHRPRRQRRDAITMSGFPHHGIQWAGMVGPTRTPAQIRGEGEGRGMGGGEWRLEAPHGGHGYSWHLVRQSIMSCILGFYYSCPGPIYSTRLTWIAFLIWTAYS